MPTGDDPAIQARAARFFPPRQHDILPDPPRLNSRSWTLLLGPGLLNFGLGASSRHALSINRNLLSAELRPSLFLQAGRVCSVLFSMAISGIVLNQQLERLLGS